MMIARIEKFVPNMGCWFDSNNRNCVMMDNYGKLQEFRCAASAMLPTDFFMNPQMSHLMTSSMAGLPSHKFNEIAMYLPLNQPQMSVLQREHDDLTAKLNTPSRREKLPRDFELIPHLISWVKANCISESEHMKQRELAAYYSSLEV